jgi:signal recognition particle subunit SRP19
MKDYDRFVVWLDYFNSELKRNQGRRVPLNSSTRSPTLKELEEACRKLNLEPLSQSGRYPSSASKESGYVSIKKEKPKQALIMKIARELSAVRGQAQKK